MRTTETTQRAQKPKLLVLLRQAVRVRHYSVRTEEAYVLWVRRYVLFHDTRHPAEMNAPEISDSSRTRDDSTCFRRSGVRATRAMEKSDVITWVRSPSRKR